MLRSSFTQTLREKKMINVSRKIRMQKIYPTPMLHDAQKKNGTSFFQDQSCCSA